MKTQRDNETQDLIQQLHDMVDTAPDVLDEKALLQQHELLNTMFKRMLSDCDNKSYETLPRYHLALRAQSQYLRTHNALRQLEENKEIEME